MRRRCHGFRNAAVFLVDVDLIICDYDRELGMVELCRVDSGLIVGLEVRQDYAHGLQIILNAFVTSLTAKLEFFFNGVTIVHFSKNWATFAWR